MSDTLTPKTTIRTTFVNPPIPLRHFDWQATLDGYEGGDPIGHSATETDAIADLQTEMEFRT
jgi:hypothetical protein